MTKIEWVKNKDGTKGRTWNPITGCTKISPGCKNCYAERMARRLAGRYGYPEAPRHFDVTLHPDKLGVPLRRKKPTMYFVCSMGDLFHEDVAEHIIWSVIEIAWQARWHTFQILTKRPDRMLEVLTRSSWWNNDTPPNMWLGVTAENQEWWERRRDAFFATPAALHYVSYEPALGPLVFSDDDLQQLSWVIVGGESGPRARLMHPDWARGIRDQCQASGVPFFMKSWGEWLDVSVLIEMGLDPWSSPFPEREGFIRVTKKCSGHLLDGKEWREFPR